MGSTSTSRWFARSRNKVTHSSEHLHEVLRLRHDPRSLTIVSMRCSRASHICLITYDYVGPLSFMYDYACTLCCSVRLFVPKFYSVLYALSTIGGGRLV